LVEVVQDTPKSTLPIAPGLGLGTTDQVVPALDSTNVRFADPGLL
jgi:hypothetical protein